MKIKAIATLLFGLFFAEANLQYIYGKWAVPVNGYFDASASCYYSLGYSTNYNAGKGMLNPNVLFESYELNLNSDITFMFEFTFLSSYKYGG